MDAQLLLKHGDRYSYQYTRLEIPDVLSNQVLIRVLACGINNTDIWTREGLYGDDSGWRLPLKTARGHWCSLCSLKWFVDKSS